MREIIRSVNDTNSQFVTIEWSTTNLTFNYTLTVVQSADCADTILFNEAVEMLYKKWLVGETVTFAVPTQQYNWNLQQQLIPTVCNTTDKNEYLARKAQKLIQQQYSQIQAAQFDAQIVDLHNALPTNATNEVVSTITLKAKQIDEAINAAIAATKNITLEQKWVEQGIDNQAYLQLKPQINAVFEKLKQLRENNYYVNYTTISPKVEAAYAQSKTDQNFNETRKDLIALQKEVIAIPLERWQKNELMDRLRTAFDHINTQQDTWRIQEDEKRNELTNALQKQYDVILPQATNSTFAEGFTLLKNLQDITNKTSVLREKRETFYTQLDAAFKTIKEKADTENEANFEIATKQIVLAITTSQSVQQFKEARQILVTAQNDLKEIRLSKQQKDDLFTKLRTAFDALNAEQDAYFKQRNQQNRSQIEDALQNLQRVLARKKDGIQTLYQAKDNVAAKTLNIKVDKKSDGSVANMFTQRLTEITAKVTEAETDIAQLEKKIEKLQKELKEEEK